jgi:hypothetical protein
MKGKSETGTYASPITKRLGVQLVVILLFLTSCLVMPSSDALAATATWNGGVGNWSVDGNWGLNPAPAAPPYYPTQNAPLYDVTIGGSGSIVNYDRTVTLGARIGTLEIGSGNKLVINPTVSGQYMNLFVNGGTITNNGAIDLAGNITSASLFIGSNTLLTGTGVIAMSNSSTNYIGADSSTSNWKLTIDAGQTIRGSGQIGLGSNTLNIENRGRITADQPIGLSISATYLGSGTTGMVNTGILEAVSGGTLELKGIKPLTNAGGTIQALNVSVVQLNGNSSAETQIVGGTLKTEGTGVIRAMGSTTNNTTAYNLIKDVTLTAGGRLEVTTGAILKVQSTITNDGTIYVYGGTASSNKAGLQLWSSDATLTGTGTLTMTNGNNSQGSRDPAIYSSLASYTLTNEQGHTIQGSGTIGGSTGMGFINKGTVIANQGHALTIQPTVSSSGFRNQGTLRVESGSAIWVENNFKSYDSTTQTLLEGSYIAKGGINIKTGFVKNNAAIIEFDGASSGMTSTLTNQPLLQNLEKNLGQLSIKNGKVLQTYVPFENQGQMYIGAGSIFKVQDGTSGLMQNYTQSAGSTILDGTINAASLSIQGGTLSGKGTIDASVAIGPGATVSPGTSPGILAINGSYSQDANSTLEVELLSNSLGAGVGYDKLSVSGAATLDGTIKLSLLTGYVITNGDTFDILHYDSRTGEFATWVGLGDSTTDSFYFTYAYGEHDLILTAHNAVPIPGALWLFAPALAGLIGLRRRFKIREA